MKRIITILLITVSTIAFSQKTFQGKATYQSKTTFDMKRFNNSKMSEERKKRILQRMKGMLEKTYTLDFTKAASTYKEEAKLAIPGTPGMGRFSGMMSSFSGGLRYKNTKEKVFLESKEFFGKKFLIKEELKQPEWQLETETKKIGNYTCYKATMVKKVDKFDFRSFRRKKKKKTEKEKDSTKTSVTDEIEVPKEIIITAWYTPQIPVSNGPGEYWGLPGLILEINEDRTTILCTEIVLNPAEKVRIKAPEKGKKVSREEYKKIVKKKVEEMREMFMNRRKSRNGSRRRH